MSMKLRHILLADDDPRDVDLTLAALEEQNLANNVFVVRDGAEAIDYLARRGAWRRRTPDPSYGCRTGFDRDT